MAGADGHRTSSFRTDVGIHHPAMRPLARPAGPPPRPPLVVAIRRSDGRGVRSMGEGEGWLDKLFGRRASTPSPGLGPRGTGHYPTLRHPRPPSRGSIPEAVLSVTKPKPVSRHSTDLLGALFRFTACPPTPLEWILGSSPRMTALSWTPGAKPQNQAPTVTSPPSSLRPYVASAPRQIMVLSGADLKSIFPLNHVAEGQAHGIAFASWSRVRGRRSCFS